MNHYLADNTWHALAHDLAEAAKHELDPESAIKIALASHGVMPATCRDECEGVVTKAA